ncbi:MAG TPA: deoxyribonuclease V [Chloroflexota bacterium]|nr:deoxyribonuclease V [Chloroflexota bacterium]
MHVADLHSWDVTPDEARRIQDELRDRREPADALGTTDISFVAGVDNAYSRAGAGATAYAVAVVLSFPELEVVETRYGSCSVTFPYVPGLLTFREAPAVIDAFRQVETAPDVVLFDGQGIAHFRRMGLAAHLGVVLNLPSIGCAKSRLVGRYEELADEVGAWTPLTDRGDVVGAAIRTRPGHSPLFVSPGNKVSVPIAVEIVLACCRDDQFMPEPTRQAHRLVTAYRQQHTAGT